jgi:hypothetical protein
VIDVAHWHVADDVLPQATLDASSLQNSTISVQRNRRVLTDEQLRELLALSITEALLIQHWTLSHADLAIVEHRSFSFRRSRRASLEAYDECQPEPRHLR